MTKLLISQHGMQTEKALFKALTTIGSDPHADLVINEPNLPKVVAHITLNRGVYSVQSSMFPGSVVVNQQAVRQKALVHGDVIGVGAAQIRFVSQPSDIERESSGTVEDSHRDLLAYERLLNFSQVLAQTDQIEHLFERILDETIELTHAEKGFILLIENEVPVVKVARNCQREQLVGDIEKSDSILKKVLSSRQAIVVSDAANDEEFKGSESVINFRLSSVMCVPLICRGKLLGAIYLANNSLRNNFDRKSLDVLVVFAAQAALLLQHALVVDNLHSEANELRASLEQTRFGGVIGACEGMQDVFRQIDKVAATDISVLLVGEAGTGKKLIAREIHQRSPRKQHPFIVFNCGAVPESRFEADLLGYGGKFQAAQGGTLFLGEIDAVSHPFQIEILKAIPEKCGTKNIRLVAAARQFIQTDLGDRLNEYTIAVPPLRDRGNDTLIVASYFLQKYAKIYAKDVRGFTEAAQNALLNYRWPGNVLQLENRVKRAMVLCEETQIKLSDLDLPADSSCGVLPLTQALEQFRNRYVQEALERNAGNRTKAAKELGVDPRTVFRQLKNSHLALSLCCLTLVGSLVACLDIQDAPAVTGTAGQALNQPGQPVIDARYVRPNPMQAAAVISMGSNCQGLDFAIPPIQDPNVNDRLYYLWFLDGTLLEQGTVEPGNRSTVVLSLTIDRDLLTKHDSAKVSDVFGRPHLIEFYVSNKPYLIPETKYKDTNALDAYYYWDLNFSNTAC